MTIAAQIIDHWVTGVAERHGDRLKSEFRLAGDDERLKSLSFLFFVSETLMDMTVDGIVDGIVDGADDFGVDVLHYEPVGNEIEIQIIQGKYRRNLDGAAAFPENSIARMIDAVGALFDPGRPLDLNDRLARRVEEIRSFIKEGYFPRVTAIAANNGVIWTGQAQRRIDAAGFGDRAEWRHLGCEEILAARRDPKPIDTRLQLAGQAVVESFDFRRALTGRISVSELARLTDEYNSRLFQRNIRQYLGLRGNRVNEAIAATLREPEDRSNFYFYNNGITMVCSRFAYNALQKENWKIKLTDMQIVNGGQTARTVQKIARKIGDEIESAEILVRIYEIQPDDDVFVEAITFATNSQNPVVLRDMKANHPGQKNLAASIEALGYAYRTKRDRRPMASNEFTNAAVAEAILAVWRKQPHRARFRGARHFGELYETIFTEDLNGAQAVTAALLHRHAENRRRKAPEDAPDFLAYGAGFAAMLMGRYLLADMGIAIDRLDHRNFDRARRLVEQRRSDYLERAEREIAGALDRLFNGREKTLQRLSATFRRGDLVEMLTEEDDA